MDKQNQIQLAEKFQLLHQQMHMFVIPNVWDAGSAVIFEKQKFPAVATTSAGVAFALGCTDGQNITIDDLAHKVVEITNKINIPLSVDFERGYSEDIEMIKENARKLVFCGAVGFNIEDGKADGTLDELPSMLKKIHVLKELKKETGIPFVINARTCTYLLNVADEEEKMRIAVERGNAFREAGADCVFIPGEMEKETVAKLVESIKAPLNILLNNKFHDFVRLNQLGVKRLSVGSVPVRSVLNYLILLAGELKEGKPEKILNNSLSYSSANQYFEK